MPAMTSQRPYLIRALWEWIADNGMTPHLLVDANVEGVRVPPSTVNDGKVVLNIAERAVAHLQMGNEDIAFSARFGGVTHAVIVPVDAVLAIYARETGQGMALPMDVAAASQAEGDGAADAATDADGAVAGDEVPAAGPRAAPAAASLSLVHDGEADAADGGQGKEGDDDPTHPTPPPAGGRARLRVVK